MKTPLTDASTPRQVAALTLQIAVIVGALLVAGCSTVIPEPKCVSYTPTRQQKIPASCALIIDKALLSKTKVTNAYAKFVPHLDLNVAYRFYGDFRFPEGVAAQIEKPSPLNRAAWFDFSACMITNVTGVIGGQFAKFTTINPQESVSADLFIVPETVEAYYLIADSIWGTAKSQLRMTCNYSLLNSNRDHILSVTTQGLGNWTLVAGDIPGKYNAIGYSVVTLSTNAAFMFIADHTEFFNSDESAQKAAIPQVLLESELSAKHASILVGYAVGRDRIQLLEGLLARGISPNIANPDDLSTPLHVAAFANNTAAISRLVSAGGKINVKDKAKRLPIYCSAWKDNVEATQALLDLDSEIDVTDLSMRISSIGKVVAFGDYYVSQWRKDRAKTCYEFALNFASSSAVQLAKDAASVEAARAREAFVAALQNSVINAGLSAISSIQQASFSQSIAQGEAMKQATKTGTGFSGYNAAYQANYSQLMKNSPAPTTQGQPLLMLGSQAQTLNVESQAQSGSVDALRQLSKQAEQESAAIKQKLAALETASSYEEYEKALKPPK